MAYFLFQTLILIGLIVGIAGVVDAIQNYKGPRND